MPHAILPHLKIISETDNRGSGGKYGAFVTACQMSTRRDTGFGGGGNFLVVPVPAVPVTNRLCHNTNVLPFALPELLP